jgi:hypothetical protein
VTAGYSGCCQNIMRKKPTETTVRWILNTIPNKCPFRE